MLPSTHAPTSRGETLETAVLDGCLPVCRQTGLGHATPTSTHLIDAFGDSFISTLEGVCSHQPALEGHRLGCTGIQQDLAHFE